MSTIRSMLGLKTSHLTADEKAELAKLEIDIQRGLRPAIEAGQALAKIRDKQLYRESFETFEAYCKERWKLSGRRCYQLIAAADVAENLNLGSATLTEKAARGLVGLPADEQKKAFDEAAAQVEPGQPVPARLVEEAAAKRRPPRRKKKAPKAIRIKVPGGLVIIERRNAELDPAQLLADAIAKLQTTTERKAA